MASQMLVLRTRRQSFPILACARRFSIHPPGWPACLHCNQYMYVLGRIHLGASHMQCIHVPSRKPTWTLFPWAAWPQTSTCPPPGSEAPLFPSCAASQLPGCLASVHLALKLDIETAKRGDQAWRCPLAHLVVRGGATAFPFISWTCRLACRFSSQMASPAA